MSWLYETHLHTSQASACASSRGADYISVYQDLGYTGIFVTDHFYRGNNCIDDKLRWKDWVRQFCAGYEDARNEGERRGLDVFFAWEESFYCDDYLIYGLDMDWLIAHPEARNWTRKEQYEAVTSSGGCIVQAHPFRQFGHINGVRLSTALVDGVEAANACNAESSFDALALRYAQILGHTVTAGSDIHSVRQARSGNVFGVSLKEKLGSAKDYVKVVRQNNIEGLHITMGRCDLYGNERVIQPVEIRGKDDILINMSWQKLLGI